MSNRFGTIITAVLFSSMLFYGCNKQSSTDKPLTPTYNASVYIGGDNHLFFAIDPATGSKNWVFSAGSAITASPLVYNERVYVGGNSAANVGAGFLYSDSLYKLNAQTGAFIKAFYDNTNPFHIVATPTADANLIYLGCSNNTIYAIDTGTFAVKWSYITGGPIRSSPVVYNGYVYFGCDDGNIYCIDKTNGNATSTYFWQWNPFPSISTRTVAWTSSPAIGIRSYAETSDTVLCIGGNDSMYCLKLDGSTHLPIFLWAYSTSSAVVSSPTLYGGACVYGCNNDTVYSVDLYSGLPRWKFPTMGSVNSSPYAKDQVIYVGSNDDNLYAINFVNGSQKWARATSGMIKSSPIVYGASVFVGSYDKSFYAIDVSIGQIQWSFVINNNIDCSPAFDNNTGGFGVNSSVSGLTN